MNMGVGLSTGVSLRVTHLCGLGFLRCAIESVGSDQRDLVASRRVVNVGVVVGEHGVGA